MAINLRIQARLYDQDFPVELMVKDGIIAEIKPLKAEQFNRPPFWIAPGFFDLQINGALGFSFVDPDLTEKQVLQIVRCCHSHGITSLCPTLITTSTNNFLHGFSTLEVARQNNAILARSIAGYHLEGPWINQEEGPRGAHPRDQVRLPDWDEFLRYQDAANGRILLVTLAPELPGALPMIERLTDRGVVVAIGHTAANANQIDAAVAAGARLSTHLGNGCSSLMDRHFNPIWPQLGNNRLWASLIADGHHLPASMLRSLLQAKSPARTILTCDASSLAGLPPGNYTIWTTRVQVLNTGKIILSDTGYLAGSGLFTDSCISEVLLQTDFNLSEAIAMASDNPRQLLQQKKIDIAIGAPADLTLFQWQPGSPLEIQGTLLEGKWVWRREKD